MFRATIILSLLISSQAFACLNKITLEDARKAIAKDPTAKASDSGELCFDGIDWETAELKEILTPKCTTNELDETTCVDEPSGQFELKENPEKKQAKEAKQKADQDAAAQAQEAKKARQTEIKTLAQKPGNLTATEIQRLLKSLAQEIEAK